MNNIYVHILLSFGIVYRLKTYVTTTLPKPYYDASLRRKKHSEEQLIDKFDELKKIHGINSMSNHIHDVYILTYNSPCNDCARDLKNLANNQSEHSFSHRLHAGIY